MRQHKGSYRHAGGEQRRSRLRACEAADAGRGQAALQQGEATAVTGRAGAQQPQQEQADAQGQPPANGCRAPAAKLSERLGLLWAGTRN